MGVNPGGYVFSQRQLRVGELLKKLLSDLFLKEEVVLPNIRTKNITITEVRMSPDLKHAKIFFMPLAGLNSENTQAALIEYKSQIKFKVSQQWRNKFLPSLNFVLDESFDYAEKIEKIILENKKHA